MGRKEKIKLKEEAFLNRIYDLILDKETTEDERIELLKFKNEVEKGKDFELETMKLAKSLRLLALSKFNKNKENLSKGVGKLYMDISSTGFLKAELAYGIITLSGVLGNH
ncbi:bacteriocin immunity protein [Clostridium chrysemydis]|uniref:bacteriocin immunity protein n=1 Tax=Clostridium chrysemydis TaxID=2665504 RepID=UPI0018836268|nr:bacteriocin immunity protein [Clostridium chrysemydis]